MAKPDSENPYDEAHMYLEDIDSSCSTPFVSAPSSPGRGQPLTIGGGGFFYSAPASPMHFVLCSASSTTSMNSEASVSNSSYEFEFSARFGMFGTASGGGSMSSADELFLNGQIRPMKLLSSHVQRPQGLEPLLDLDELEGDGVNDDDDDTKVIGRGRDVKWRDRSLRRRTRSMSPLRTPPAFEWNEKEKEKRSSEISEGTGVEDCDAIVESKDGGEETTPSMSASSSSRSSSSSSSSKSWVFLKEFLYRSKSEGRNNNNGPNKFWSSISFSGTLKDRKEKTMTMTMNGSSSSSSSECGGKKKKKNEEDSGDGGGIRMKARKGVVVVVVGGKRRIQVVSPHEVHYKASRAHAEELRKKTFLPYRQGLFGCLGFSSKGYGAAINGFASRAALNPTVST